MTKHPQKRIMVRLPDLKGGFERARRIHVDAEIAPLIKELWHKGFMTRNSCQDNRGRMWLMFWPGYGFLERFRKLMADAPRFAEYEWRDDHADVHFPPGDYWWILARLMKPKTQKV